MIPRSSTTSLIQRLRERGSEGADLSPGDPLCLEAADEIERLLEVIHGYRMELANKDEKY